MSNKNIRMMMEQIYGKGCMFKKAKIAERIEKMGGIKTYKRFLQEKRYTFKQIRKAEKVLTYHHLQHKFEGGQATIQNGAEINSLAHCYIHSLDRQSEEVINDMLREYKKGIECGIEFVDEVDLSFNIAATTIIPAELEKKREKYNRAKEKQKWQKEVGDDL